MNARQRPRLEQGARVAAALRAELLRQFPDITEREADALALVVRRAEEGHACIELAALAEGDSGIDAAAGTAMADALRSSALVATVPPERPSRAWPAPTTHPGAAREPQGPLEAPDGSAPHDAKRQQRSPMEPSGGSAQHDAERQQRSVVGAGHARDRDATGAVAMPAEPAAGQPFVRDAGRIYLRRLWTCEHALAARLHAHAAAAGDLPVDPAAFAQAVADATPAQRLAVAHSLASRLTVVAGGPGTGKTWTAARIVALHAALRGPEARIAVAAPTGKAATRLREACAALGGEAAARLHASTLHALLGLRPDSARARHHAGHPLPLDLLVVDECSMIDLPLFTALLDAVPQSAHLVLIGDAAQLPAIGGGAVFSDLVALGRGAFGPGTQRALSAWGAAAPGAAGDQWGDAVVELRLPVRFDGAAELPAALEALRAGARGADLHAALAAAGIARAPGPPDWRDPQVQDSLRALWQPLAAAEAPEQALQAVDAFRILAGPRLGPAGVAAANRACADALGITDAEAWFHGRPLLVTANDPRLGLFNGDVGVVLAPPGEAPMAWFRGRDGRPHGFEPAGLPPHETAYAMTVHKAQGSEFARAWLLLPEPDSPLLTREWLYTALSRARGALTVFGEDAALEAAATRRLRRCSGLADRLRGPVPLL